MKLFRLSGLMLMLIMLTACVEDLTADDTRAYQILARGESAQSDDKRIQVISSQNSFDEVHYQLLNRSGTADTINFEQYQVLLVMAGAAYNTRQIEISGFVGTDKQVQVVLKTDYAGANCATPAVIRQPWMLVLFPKVEKPLQVTEQVSVTNC
ncbi:MAG TPA: hypothetical protein VLA40_04760 [Rheinheimera sp.]|nr:hypothetical protein [Rheinheimera sp.]